MKLGSVLLLVGCLWLLPAQSRSANGYRALIGCGDGFLAAGSGGRMDWISPSGAVTKSIKSAEVDLNALLSFQQTLLAAGDRGTLLISTDNQTFRRLEIGTNASIFCLVSFHDQILAGSEQGKLLIGDVKGAFKQLSLPLEGNIVSLSANETVCFGVTDKGEMLHSTDGSHWEVFDFNAYYAGYYKPCQFTCIFVAENQISAAGKNLDGTPVLMVSAQGTVWSERSLNYADDQGIPTSLTAIPSSICLDETNDQLLLTCSKGQLMTIPSCSHCNKCWTISTEDISVITKNGEGWFLVGDKFLRHFVESIK